MKRKLEHLFIAMVKVDHFPWEQGDLISLSVKNIFLNVKSVNFVHVKPSPLNIREEGFGFSTRLSYLQFTAGGEVMFYNPRG
jgi:hypothetical protein